MAPPIQQPGVAPACQGQTPTPAPIAEPYGGGRRGGSTLGGLIDASQHSLRFLPAD